MAAGVMVLWGALCGLLAGSVLMGVSALASRSVWDGTKEERRKRIGNADSATSVLVLAAWGAGAALTESYLWALGAAAGAALIVGGVLIIDPGTPACGPDPRGRSRVSRST